MSMPDSPVLSNLDLISNCFTELRVERDQLGEFLSDSLTQFDQWRKELEQNWRQISEERIELARQCQMLNEEHQHQTQDQTNQHSHQSAQIGELESQLVIAHQQISEVQAAETNRDQVKSTQVQELQEECNQFSEKLTASQDRVAQLEKSLETLARAQDMLEALDDATDDSQHSFTANEDIEAAIQELALHKQQVAELQNERDALEKELDTVRVRACELNDTVDLTKRQMAEQQAQWARELNQMRQVLEDQATTITAGRASAPVAASGGQQTSPSEQVVGNVMAQFDRLRQQRAQRCAEKDADKELQKQ